MNVCHVAVPRAQRETSILFHAWCRGIAARTASPPAVVEFAKEGAEVRPDCGANVRKRKRLRGDFDRFTAASFARPGGQSGFSRKLRSEIEVDEGEATGVALDGELGIIVYKRGRLHHCFQRRVIQSVNFFG